MTMTYSKFFVFTVLVACSHKKYHTLSLNVHLCPIFTVGPYFPIPAVSNPDPCEYANIKYIGNQLDVSLIVCPKFSTVS